MYKYTLDIDMTYAIYSIHVIKYVDIHSEGGNHGIGVYNLFLTKLINIQKHVQLRKNEERLTKRPTTTKQETCL